MPWKPMLCMLAILAHPLLAGPARGQAESGEEEIMPIYFFDPVLVEGRIDELVGVAESASQGRVGIEDLELRPLLREGELLETVPGMIVTQHSGDGKSNQMFLRGFNLDHGTDFRTEVDGMPVNLPTHGHGQGYTDLNFLIPEVVDFVEFRKGVYYADVGDFGSAGSARFHLTRKPTEKFFKFEAGGDRYVRAVGASARELGWGTLLLAGEAKGYEGPWQISQDLKKISGIARYTIESGDDELSFLAMGYGNKWDASDQIPKRAVDAGLIDRFGQIDPGLGGNSSRFSLSGSWRRERKTTLQNAAAYAIYYDLDLYSNFTYFLEDSVHGDQFQQVDERVVIGGSYDYHRAVSAVQRDHIVTLGVQTRADLVSEVGLHRTLERRHVGTVRDDEVTEATVGIYAAAESNWHPKFRSVLGLRGDIYYFDVQSHLEENSGTETDGRISPKLTLIFRPSDVAELYLNGGVGFHSNDARGTTISVDPVTGEPAEPVDPLVTSRGAEFGLRLSPVSNMRSTISLWTLELDSELLFVGDAGNTEPTDESRRLGIELANFYRPLPWLSLDLDVSVSRARIVDAPKGEDRIPGALENVLAAGVTVNVHNGVFGSLRVRHLGEYPLIEDNSVRAEATTMVNAGLGYDLSGIRLGLTVLNLLDTKASDIQYYYGSRLPGEPGEVEDIHFHPVEPRQVRAGFAWAI